MKRVLSFICLLLLFALCAFGAAAENATQEYLLTSFGDSYTLSATSEPTFWEQPDLKAGEVALDEGYLVLTNNTNEPQTLTFATVRLPYNDKASLIYLNHLHVTVSHDGKVLYEGPYSEINNGTFKASDTLQPQQSASYAIRLYCDYTYSGTGLQNNAILDWCFSIEGQKKDASEPSFDLSRVLQDTLFKEILIAVGVTAVIVVILLILDRRKDRE